MCKSFLLILFSQISMTFLRARRLSSLVPIDSVIVVIAIFSSAQRQLSEKPTSPLLVVVGGILASAVLWGDS